MTASSSDSELKSKTSLNVALANSKMELSHLSQTSSAVQALLVLHVSVFEVSWYFSTSFERT